MATMTIVNAKVPEDTVRIKSGDDAWTMPASLWLEQHEKYMEVMVFLHELRDFALGHHSQQESCNWLHALTIDVPAMIEKQLDASPTMKCKSRVSGTMSEPNLFKDHPNAVPQQEPAWVTRMAKATDKDGYHCSGFEANAIAREWRQMRERIEELEDLIGIAKSLKNHYRNFHDIRAFCDLVLKRLDTPIESG